MSLYHLFLLLLHFRWHYVPTTCWPWSSRARSCVCFAEHLSALWSWRWWTYSRLPGPPEWWWLCVNLPPWGWLSTWALAVFRVVWPGSSTPTWHEPQRRLAERYAQTWTASQELRSLGSPRERVRFGLFHVVWNTKRMGSWDVTKTGIRPDCQTRLRSYSAGWGTWTDCFWVTQWLYPRPSMVLAYLPTFRIIYIGGFRVNTGILTYI